MRYGIVVVVVSSLFAVPIAGGPAVSIDGRTVTVRGFTPGAGAVFFSVAHEPHLAYASVLRITQYIADDDGDGIVSYVAASDISWNALWIVVDVGSGGFVSGMRDGSTGRRAADGRTVTKKDAAGEWSRLSHQRSWLELLVVRPADAAWRLTAMRGGAADVEKKREPLFDTPVDLFIGLTPKAHPLKQLKKGDLLLAIDPERVEYFAVEVQ